MPNSCAMWSQKQPSRTDTHPPSAPRTNTGWAYQTHRYSRSVGRLLGDIKVLYSSPYCISELAQHKHVCV